MTSAVIDRADDLASPLELARWIRPGEQRATLPAQAAWLSRKHFTLTAPVRRATLHATALGVYDVQLNGIRLGNALLRPGWTDVSRRVQFQSHDVTDALRVGSNVVGAVVAPGWYGGRIGTDRESRPSPRTPQLLVGLDIETTEGEHLAIGTDESWQWRCSEIERSDLYDGEVIDLRLAIADWAAPGATDLGTWEGVELSAGTAATLTAEQGPPIRETDTYPVTSINWLGDGTAVLDLTRNEAGFARLQVDVAPATRVRIDYGELVDVDGRVYQENLRSAACSDTFVCTGDGVEELAPRFTFRGARYAQVCGLPGPDALVAAERVVIGSDVRRVGWFESSDATLNDIYAAVLTSQRANFLEVPTDCPQRDERLGWLADALLFTPLAAYNYDLDGFLSKWFDDVLDARTPAGQFTDVAPRPTGRVTFRNREGAPAWADAGVLMPWLVYQRYGRRDVLGRMFPAMLQWLRVVHGDNPDGVWTVGRGRDYGDWVPAGPDTSHDLFATAWLAHTTEIAARVAALVGADADRAWLTERAGAARAAFHREFVDDTAGRVRAVNPIGSPAAARRFAPSVQAETQTGYVLALAFGLVDGELASTCGDRLAELVVAAGRRLQTGFIGSAFLLDALSASGHSELAAELLLRKLFPSLGYMVDQGATSIWERWDGLGETGQPGCATMNSFNHYCLGSMFRWAIESLCGLQPGAEPGFAAFRFAPTATSQVRSTSFRFLSPAGEITVRCDCADGTVDGEVTVPGGARCVIASVITIDGAPARLQPSSGPGADLTVGPGVHAVSWRT